MAIIGYWILDENGKPVPVGKDAWTLWAHYELKKQTVETLIWGIYLVSTIYLGMAMVLDDGAPPLLWQTMIFSYGLTGWHRFHATKAEALAGHDAAVAWCRGEGEEPK